MRMLKSRYGAVAFLLKPHPLQFQLGGEDTSWSKELELEFEASRRKLELLYRRGWNAIPLGEHWMVVSPSHKVKTSPETNRWSLESKELGAA